MGIKWGVGAVVGSGGRRGEKLRLRGKTFTSKRNKVTT